jgi:hypothetical protein
MRAGGGDLCRRLAEKKKVCLVPLGRLEALFHDCWDYGWQAEMARERQMKTSKSRTIVRLRYLRV